MRLRRNSLTEIIKSRIKKDKGLPLNLVTCQSPEDIQDQTSENKIASLLSQDQLDNQNKLFLLHHIETTHRITFNPTYPTHLFKWHNVNCTQLIDKNYDFNKKSYFLFKGTIMLFEKTIKSETNDVLPKGRPFFQINKQGGIGPVFSIESTFPKCAIYAEKALILQVQHPNSELELVERNCIMTSKEKLEALKTFKIFEDIDDFQRHFLAFFKPRKCCRGEIIYKLGQLSLHFYLIIQGQVQVLAPLLANSTQKCDNVLAELTRKNHNVFNLATQILGQGSYFGQQQIFADSLRTHSAKCLTVTCLLLTIPIEIFQKLMKFPSFMMNIKASSRQKQFSRGVKLENYSKLKTFPATTEKQEEDQQMYDMFKTSLLKSIEEDKQPSNNRKLSLQRSKRKIMHGHSIKIPRHDCSPHEERQFSMLKVNQSMYLKTLKRFRHCLKDIDRLKQPKKKVELGEGRTLQTVWKLLRLEKIYNEDSDQENEKICSDEGNGRKTFEDHARLTKQLRNSNGYRPKGRIADCRIKQEYLQYLQHRS